MHPCWRPQGAIQFVFGHHPTAHEQYEHRAHRRTYTQADMRLLGAETDEHRRNCRRRSCRKATDLRQGHHGHRTVCKPDAVVAKPAVRAQWTELQLIECVGWHGRTKYLAVPDILQEGGQPFVYRPTQVPVYNVWRTLLQGL